MDFKLELLLKLIHFKIVLPLWEFLKNIYRGRVDFKGTRDLHLGNIIL